VGNPALRARRAIPLGTTVDVALVAAGLAFLGWRTLIWSERTIQILGEPFFDWIFYRRAVERWLTGESLYPGGVISTLTTTAGASYSYPPASVPLMLPFAADPIGAWLWEACLFIVLLAGVFAVVRVGWPNHSLRAFAVALLGLGLFVPVLEGLAVANVNIATAGALGLVWATPRLAVPAAGILGVLKVFPVALAAPSGVRTFARALGLTALICLLTLPLVGLGSWLDYANALASSTPLCGTARTNPSFACAIAPLVGSGLATIVGLLLAGAALVVAFKAGRNIVGMTAVVAAIMLPATELHLHYFAKTFVLALIGMSELRGRASLRRSPAVPGVAPG
jgi:hypothetical protein